MGVVKLVRIESTLVGLSQVNDIAGCRVPSLVKLAIAVHIGMCELRF